GEGRGGIDEARAAGTMDADQPFADLAWPAALLCAQPGLRTLRSETTLPASRCKEKGLTGWTRINVDGFGCNPAAMTPRSIWRWMRRCSKRCRAGARR